MTEANKEIERLVREFKIPDHKLWAVVNIAPKDFEQAFEDIKDDLIDFISSSLQLKEKHKTDFDKWLKDKFIKVSDVDYTNKSGDAIWTIFDLRGIYTLFN